jgi:tRNA pseudouridine38-40 synthase
VKTRYFIFISYKGTSYHGWQLQPNSVTVQKIIDNALSVVLGEIIMTTGAGRTDTGVHALVFCAHFDSLSPDLSREANLVFRLNRFLPEDISVNFIRKALPDANARFSAISRTYKYYISRVKDPFFNSSSWYLHGEMNVAAMNDACAILFRHSDFTSFSRLHSGSITNICRIYEAQWEMEGNRLVFTIKADRFLRNMVRAIVGTMVDVGFGKLNPEGFEKIIQARDRSSAGTSAPARGLFLFDIEYPPEIFVPDLNKTE